jgi:AraC-like DNA-binding protein
MERASKLFVLEEANVRSPFVEKIWRTRRSEPAESFISVAASHSEIVVTKTDGRAYVTVRGPETMATTLPIPQNAEFFGIQFRPGAFMPSLPAEDLVDRAVTLPAANSKSFWLSSSAFEIPDYDNLDQFVSRLVREGLLVRDPLIESALNGELRGVSQRSVQRRFLRATGLTQATYRQIERAHSAVDLLESGTAILETVQRAGYADQAHLTRSLKRFAGQTPARIVRERNAG